MRKQLLAAAFAASALAAPAAAAPPARLSDTGLWGGGEVGAPGPGVLPFAPQYPLWSDGATKRRWVRLPPRTFIDGRDPESWVFPLGTRFWKEFSLGGRRVETRMLERTRAGWQFATYVWNPEGTDATLAPARGLAVEVAPGRRHAIPSLGDCHACHDGGKTPVLGFSALQLSPDRDPGAPHAEPPPPGAVDLDSLSARRLLRGLPRGAAPPRIAARTPVERAALGYLHANCGACHNGSGPLASLGMRFDQPPSGDAARVLSSTVGYPSRFRPIDGSAVVRIAAGNPAASTLTARIRSRSPLAQMPPLATAEVDEEGSRLIEEWIEQLNRKDHGP